MNANPDLADNSSWLAMFIATMLIIIVAGVLMFMQSGGVL